MTLTGVGRNARALSLLVVIAVAQNGVSLGQAISETPLDPSRFPSEICKGLDQSVWFSEVTAQQIGRLGIDGSLTEYATPRLDTYPRGIVAGPDGNYWFTAPGIGAIERITPT